jgi:hypothetical protein
MRAETPLEPPRDLTVPLPGSTTLRDLVSRSLQLLLRETPALLVEAAREVHASGFRAWSEALRREPAAVASLLKRPHLGGLVRVLRSTTEPAVRTELLVELLATLSYELSVTPRAIASLALEHRPSRIVALGARRVVSGAEGRATAGPPYFVLAEPILFGLADNNPLAMREAHPNKSGNAIDLGGKEVEAWTASLKGALGLSKEFVPELRSEMDLCIELVVPVGFDAEKHLSASYAEVPGTVYLSLHPDPMTMAEALVHEFSHTKLNLLSEHDAVLENAFEPLFPSPVRPDPRPLWGVLLAVHAFLAVELFYTRMRERGHAWASNARFETRARDIRAMNEEGLAVLTEHARPTRVGRGLLAELSALGERFRVAR